MAQLMPLLVLAHPGSPGKRAVKRVCACVRACVCVVCHVCLAAFRAKKPKQYDDIKVADHQ